jgi:hypothetical protein
MLQLAAVVGLLLGQGQPSPGNYPNGVTTGTSLTVSDSNGSCVLSNASGPVASESCATQVPTLKITDSTDAVVGSIPSGSAICFNGPAVGSGSTTSGNACVYWNIPAGGYIYWTQNFEVAGGAFFNTTGLALNMLSGATLRLNSTATDDIKDNGNGGGLWIAGGTNQSITLEPSGTGGVLFAPAGVTAASVDSSGRFVTYGTAPRKQGSYQTITNADTTFTAVGLPAPTLLSGTAGTADTTDTAYQMVKYTTSTTSGNAVSVSGPFTTTQPSYLPLFYAVVRTDPAAVTSTRIYVGLTQSSLDQVATLAAANTVKNCTFRYDTGIGDAAFFAESSDGTTASASTTSVSVAAATTYVLQIDQHVSGECDFYVNGVLKVAKTTNIPTGATAEGVESSITTLTTAARSLSTSKVILAQN